MPAGSSAGCLSRRRQSSPPQGCTVPGRRGSLGRRTPVILTRSSLFPPGSRTLPSSVGLPARLWKSSIRLFEIISKEGDFIVFQTSLSLLVHFISELEPHQGEPGGTDIAEIAIPADPCPLRCTAKGSSESLVCGRVWDECSENHSSAEGRFISWSFLFEIRVSVCMWEMRLKLTSVCIINSGIRYTLLIC